MPCGGLLHLHVCDLQDQGDQQQGIQEQVDQDILEEQLNNQNIFINYSKYILKNWFIVIQYYIISMLVHTRVMFESE